MSKPTLAIVFTILAVLGLGVLVQGTVGPDDAPAMVRPVASAVSSEPVSEPEVRDRDAVRSPAAEPRRAPDADPAAARARRPVEAEVVEHEADRHEDAPLDEPPHEVELAGDEESVAGAKAARPIPKSLEAMWEKRRAAGSPPPVTRSPALVGLGGAPVSALDESGDPAEERPIVTRWTPGDSWAVETYYRNMAAPTSDQWSDPLGWSFRVVDRTTLKDEEVFEVEVTLVKPASADFPPSFFYITEDRRLIATKTVVREQGEDRTLYVFFDEDPSAAASGHFSIVPFELPSDRGQGRRLAADATIPDDVPAAVLALFPRPESWLGAGSTYLEVEFENRIDGTTIRQLWSETDTTWPATSFTPSRRSYRIR